MDEKQTRNNNTPIKVYCLKEENELIKQHAVGCGLSISVYLRKLGLGYIPPSLIDNKKIDDLLRVNGDLGRLGGLLKLWLTSERHLVEFTKHDVRVVLSNIEQSQVEIRQVVKEINKHL